MQRAVYPAVLLALLASVAFFGQALPEEVSDTEVATLIPEEDPSPWADSHGEVFLEFANGAKKTVTMAPSTRYQGQAIGVIRLDHGDSSSDLIQGSAEDVVSWSSNMNIRFLKGKVAVTKGKGGTRELTIMGKLNKIQGDELGEPAGVTMSTPNSKNYGSGESQRAFSGLPQSFGIDIAVTANNDAHIFLGTGGSPASGNGYEIVLGGWGNSRSVVREGKAGSEKTRTDGAVVGGGEKKFKIVKSGSSLKVLKEDGLIWLEYDSASQAVSEVWFMTGWGSSGQWSATVASGEPLSTLAENNFDDRGSSSLSTSSTYTYTLANGYTAKLSGWTHTRDYAKGFLRNKAGEGVAVVEGLQAGSVYAWKVYQFASTFAGSNPLSVNGVSQGSTTQGNSDAATAEGQATATSDGKITFTFTRSSHHVHLSGLAVAEAEPPTVALTGTYMEGIPYAADCDGNHIADAPGWDSSMSGQVKWGPTTRMTFPNGEKTFEMGIPSFDAFGQTWSLNCPIKLETRTHSDGRHQAQVLSCMDSNGHGWQDIDVQSPNCMGVCKANNDDTVAYQYHFCIAVPDECCARVACATGIGTVFGCPDDVAGDCTHQIASCAASLIPGYQQAELAAAAAEQATKAVEQAAKETANKAAAAAEQTTKAAENTSKAVERASKEAGNKAEQATKEGANKAENAGKEAGNKAERAGKAVANAFSGRKGKLFRL